MAEAVEAGAGLAWRLLATLEGGSLLLATSALIAYTTRRRLAKQTHHKTVHSVLVTNTSSTLGIELKRRLEARGCSVKAPSDARAQPGVDALVVVGAESVSGLNGISALISEDVYENLKLLESLSRLVRRGGSIAWACAGKASGNFDGATSAFDAVIRASVNHIAKISHCDPVWVDRSDSPERAAESLIARLLPCTIREHSGFSFRNAAHKASEFLGRWLKVLT